jgi:hypothetical protein
MKKIIIKSLSEVKVAGATMEDPAAWIAEGVAANWWGLPERPELDEMGEPTGVMLPAEYSIEIIDLDQDPEYLLQQCHAKRQAEYPSLGEFADAFVKMQNGDSLQMEAYVTACMAVKAKYPKP